jgi:hypothetical protein
LFLKHVQLDLAASGAAENKDDLLGRAVELVELWKW